MQISRRRFLALSATFTVAACSSDDDIASLDPVATPEPTDPDVADTEAAAPTSPASSDVAPTTEPDEANPIELDTDPFAFGVASGDPDATSVVLWTRLDGDLPDRPIPVDWEFTGDDGTVASGTADTDADMGHSLHVVTEVAGPGSFVFDVGGFTSPVGRTAPIDPTATEFRFAAASCQHYETGRWAAHRDIAEWGPDLVVFLGDFIYEGDPSPLGGQVIRPHENPEPMDVAGYRIRYATYLRDPQLQASRAAAPLLSIWDDHEVENNYAGVISQDDVDPAVFAERRAAAYQVWWENTPTRLDAPTGSPGEAYRIHRGIDVGDLVRISALDGRQFRSDQVSEVTLDVGPPADGWDDPARTMLGDEQEAWIGERFSTSSATWNCLAQQTILSDGRIGDGAILNYDQWDGYSPARDRLLANAPSNFVTVTGDIHLAGVGEVGPIGAPVGIEFVSTAISSVASVDPELRDVVVGIPSIVDAELEFRGYTRHTVTPGAWTAEYRQVLDIADPDSEVDSWKTFQVTSGTPAVAET